MDLLTLPKRPNIFSTPSTTLPTSLPPIFHLPGHLNPVSFVNTHCSPGTYTDNGQKVKFAKGTTTLAFLFSKGAIIAVDSRASQGSFVSSQTVQKVIPITDSLLGTMAGGAADCLFWQRNLGCQVRLFELRNKERCPVRAASKMLANTMQYYKGMGLSMGTMVGGWDYASSRAEIYYIDDDGTRLEATRNFPYFAVGSGGTYAYAILDSHFKWDMTEEEAVELGRKAIYHATFRDAGSGGVNNVYVITGEKWKKLEGIDVETLHYEMAEKKRTAMEM